MDSVGLESRMALRAGPRNGEFTSNFQWEFPWTFWFNYCNLKFHLDCLNFNVAPKTWCCSNHVRPPKCQASRSPKNLVFLIWKNFFNVFWFVKLPFWLTFLFVSFFGECLYLLKKNCLAWAIAVIPVPLGPFNSFFDRDKCWGWASVSFCNWHLQFAGIVFWSVRLQYWPVMLLTWVPGVCSNLRL